MTPQIVAERLLACYGEPDFEQLVHELQPHLTVEVIAYLKERVDEEKLRDANHALHLATLADALVSSALPTPEAEALAHWAKGSALLHLSRYQEALDYCQRAATIYTALNQKLALIDVQRPMVAALRNLGDYKAALVLAQEARETCLVLGVSALPSLAGLEMNVGVIYKQLGEPEAALQAYQRGREIFSKLGDTIEVARIDINRANILRMTSRFMAAKELLHDARRTLTQTGQHTQQIARVDAILGLLTHQSGRYQEALAHFENARRGFTGMETLIAMVDLRRCLIYSKFNMIAETINLALTAEPIFSQNGMFEEQALALYQLGIGYQLAGHYTLAEDYLSQARQRFEEQEVRARIFELDYNLAYLAYLTSRFDKARQLASRLCQQAAPETWPMLVAQAQLLLAQCALIEAKVEEASDYAQAALTLSLDYALRTPAIAAHHLMGQILERKGVLQGAWSQYQTAIQQIEALRLELLVDEFRIGFMDDKLPIYAAAVRLSQQIMTPSELLYTLNLAQTAPLSYLASSPLDQSLEDDSMGSELQGDLTTLREEWHWYQNKLEEASNDSEASDILTRLREVEAKLADLTHRWRLHQTSSTTAHVAFAVAPETPEGFLASIQQQLGPNEALLHYYVINDTFQALLVSAETISLQPNLSPTKPLERLLSGWRFHLNQTHLINQSPQTSLILAQRHLKRFYQALIAPLAASLANISHLFIVMPPAWHDLPLNAFFDGQAYLIERYEVTYLSAPEVLHGNEPHKRESSQPDGKARRQALIVGHSDHGQLPGILRATHTVAQKLSAHWSTTVLVDEEATADKVQAASQQSHLIHLATHATFRADNPLFSWARLAEHRLTVGELYQMKLPQSPLVVLSACQTGQGQARGGGLLGMGRALLAAGALGVLVTLWRVEDEATAQLMVDFYDLLQSHHQIEGSKAQAKALNPTLISSALRQAQQQAIARQQHPFFWAAFIFIQG